MNHRTFAITILGFCLTSSFTQAQTLSNTQEGIGLFTAVAGTVMVTHTNTQIKPVNLHDEVFFKDIIATDADSRTKAFFQDDSVLTVGENSRVEITEHIYNPERNQRRMVVSLLQGKLRALVSKVFKADGSKFEIHTPTAVAAARGTYFVVWTENGSTGIVNIGESGRVDFTSGGTTVTVAPGEYSIVGAGGFPTTPAVYHTNPTDQSNPTFGNEAALTSTVSSGNSSQGTIGSPAKTLISTVGSAGNLAGRSLGDLMNALHAIEGTLLKDMPKAESPIELVRTVLPILTVVQATTVHTEPTLVGSLTQSTAQTATNTPSDPSNSGSLIASLTSSLTSTVSSTLSPVTSLVSAVASPVTSLVSQLPVVAPVVAPITAVITPVVAPVTTVIPVLPPVSILPVTPPAVISGGINVLGLPINIH